MYCTVFVKEASLKIEDLKKFEDSRLDKGLKPEDSDRLFVTL